MDLEGSPVLAPASPAERADDFAALAALLWSERAVLEDADVSAAGDAAADFAGDSALAPLGELEVLRAIEAESLAEQLGLSADASLLELASVAPPPWSLVLNLHRDALRRLIAAHAAVHQLSLEEFLR